LFVYPAVKLENDRYNDNKPGMYTIMDNMIELMTEEDEDETNQKIALDNSIDY
jgi:hypothetical protein